MSGPDQPTIRSWPHELRRDDGSPYEQPAFRPRNGVLRWFEGRLPILDLAYKTAVSYPTPRNLNYLWTFGGILSFMLVVQFVTGIVLVGQGPLGNILLGTGRHRLVA